MDYIRKKELIYKRPELKDKSEYPYSSSAKVFHTEQLFLYSEKVRPGDKSSAPHFHKKIDEIVVVTKGELVAYEDEQEVLLKEGDSVCFYANSEKRHYLQNKSDCDAEFLLFRKSGLEGDVVY